MPARDKSYQDVVRLVIDVGNSETDFGLVEGMEVRAHWAVPTPVDALPPDYAEGLREVLVAEGVDRLDQAIVGSVVQDLVPHLRDALGELGVPDLRVVAPGMPLPIRVEVEEPGRVGVDRLMNAVAAHALYARDTLIVDLGTATTFDVVTAEGIFEGGVIGAGVGAGPEWVARHARALPSVEFLPPDRVIGRGTAAALQSGLFYGAIESVEGVIRRVLAEWSKADPLVVATGGWAETVALRAPSVHRVERHLTLLGLAMSAGFPGTEGPH